jgi:hypothetical protein
VLALLAGQRDLRPYVGGSHDGVPFWARDMDMRCNPRLPRRTVADASPVVPPRCWDRRTR